MSKGSDSREGDPAWMALAYFAVYLAWLFFSLEGEAGHWPTMVLLPLALIVAFRPGALRKRIVGALRSVGLAPGRPWRGVALTVGLCVAAGLFQVAFSSRREEMVALLTSAHALVSVPVALAFLLLMTGITEEVLFRGYLQTRMERLTGSRWWGLVIASVLFGVYHLPYAYLNPQWPSHGDWSAAWLASLGQGIPGGLILGGLFLYARRNLYLPILLHAGVDLLPVALMLKVRTG